MEGLREMVSTSILKGILGGKHTRRARATLKDSNKVAPLFFGEAVCEARESFESYLAIILGEFEHLTNEIVSPKFRDCMVDVKALKGSGNLLRIGVRLEVGEVVEEARAVFVGGTWACVGELSEGCRASNLGSEGPVEVTTGVPPDSWFGTSLGFHTSATTEPIVSNWEGGGKGKRNTYSWRSA
jgi:hypothetical protein